jgi:hypothetical protein
MTNFMKELKKLKLNDTHIIFLSLWVWENGKQLTYFAKWF